MKKWKWVYQHLEEIILCILLTIVVLTSGIQVISRYVFNSSLTFSEELCRYLYIWTGFMTSSLCVKNGSIIKIDTFTGMLPKRWKTVLHFVTSILCIAVVGVLFKNACVIVEKAFISGQVSPAIKIPMWILYSGALAGLALFLLRLIQQTISLFKKPPEEEGICR